MDEITIFEKEFASRTAIEITFRKPRVVVSFSNFDCYAEYGISFSDEQGVEHLEEIGSAFIAAARLLKQHIMYGNKPKVSYGGVHLPTNEDPKCLVCFDLKTVKFRNEKGEIFAKRCEACQ